MRIPTELQRSGLTTIFAVVRLEDQPALSCSSPPYLRPVHAPVSARRDDMLRIIRSAAKQALKVAVTCALMVTQHSI